ncbi:hypothetical protein Tco_0780321 [Tanacetum coccineum]
MEAYQIEATEVKAVICAISIIKVLLIVYLFKKVSTVLTRFCCQEEVCAAIWLFVLLSKKVYYCLDSSFYCGTASIGAVNLLLLCAACLRGSSSILGLKGMINTSRL